MALKSSRPDRHADGNPRLAAALARAHDDASPERRAELLESLRAGPLLIAIEALPDPFDPTQGGEASVRFVTAEHEQQGRLLCGFSSYRALAAQAPAAVALGVDPASVVDWIAATGMTGLWLDPKGPSACVSLAEARAWLGLPALPGAERRSGAQPGEREMAVREALRGLLEAGDPTSRATLREPRTGKSLRFEREDQTLRMRLPAACLASDERARAELLFEELAGDAELPALPDREQKPDACESGDLQALFAGEVEQPARAAMKTFTWVFGFPPGFELEIVAD